MAYYYEDELTENQTWDLFQDNEFLLCDVFTLDGNVQSEMLTKEEYEKILYENPDVYDISVNQDKTQSLIGTSSCEQSAQEWYDLIQERMPCNDDPIYEEDRER